MKREILFRGKQIANGKFIEGSLTVDCHGNCWICHPLKVPMVGGFQYFDVDPNTIGQFTGMTDKNGTKIFEGDTIETEECFTWDVLWSEKGKWIACDLSYDDIQLLSDVFCDSLVVNFDKLDK